MIELRPHHGLCIQQYLGKGYNELFSEGVQNVIMRLQKNANQFIQLVCSPDEVCRTCPENYKGQCCSGQSVVLYDKKCLELCELRFGQVITWREFRNLIYDKIISKGLLKTVCIDCEWVFICEKQGSWKTR
jgi:hypothetical protein